MEKIPRKFSIFTGDRDRVREKKHIPKTMVTTARKHPPQNYLVVFQVMERYLEEESFNLEDVKEPYTQRVRAAEGERDRLEGLLRDVRVHLVMNDMSRNAVLQEICAVEALLELAKGRLQEMKTQCQMVTIAHKMATTGLRQVQATIQDLLREIADMPKDRKRRADSARIGHRL